MASVKPPRQEEDISQKSRKTKIVYETTSSSNYNADDNDNAYRSSITPRKIIIQRSASPVRQMTSSSTVTTSYSGPVNWGRSKSICVDRGQLFGGLPPPGAYTAVATTGVTSVKSTRDQEKKDLQDLNERLANYIEKVRFLEAQNKKLADELSKLKARWGKETSQVKAMYEAELHEARACLDDADKEKSRLEIRVASLEEQLDELRSRLRDVSQAWIEERERNLTQSSLMRDCEAELMLARRRIETFEADRAKDKKLIATLQDALKRARFDLDNETLLRIDAENRCISLEEELEFLKAVHEQEMKELSALVYRDTTIEHREFWKNEMGQALREIQNMYDEKLDAMKNELETFYELKIQQFRTDTTRKNVDAARMKDETTKFRTQVTDLRNKIGDLEGTNAALRRELEALKRDGAERERDLEKDCLKYRSEAARLSAELEAILIELQGVLDTKLSLELEITTYRKLLEGEENRGGLLQTLDKYSRYETSEETKMSENSYGTLTQRNGVSGSSLVTQSNSGALTTGTDTTTTRVTQVVKGEMSAKTINSRSAKGHLVIAESASDGTSVTVENTGRKDEDLTGWRLKRTVDGLELPEFIFQEVTLKPNAKLKIWAMGSKPLGLTHSSDLLYSENSWGTGLHISTKLANTKNEDRASHTQKTVYLSTLPTENEQQPGIGAPAESKINV